MTQLCQLQNLRKTGFLSGLEQGLRESAAFKVLEHGEFERMKKKTRESDARRQRNRHLKKVRAVQKLRKKRPQPIFEKF